MATLEVIFGQKESFWTEKVHLAVTFSKIQLEDSVKWAAGIDCKWPETSFATLKWCTLNDRQNSLETSSRLFENQPNEICSHLSGKASKGSFLGPISSKNHTNEGKGKEKKKRARRKKGKEIFVMATLEAIFGRKRMLDGEKIVHEANYKVEQLIWNT